MKTLKHIITLLIILLFTIPSMAQNGINYKAIVKDGSGNILPNTSITVQFKILQSALLIEVYTESHVTMTDANGLMIVNIGEGTIISGDYATIDWSRALHFLNVQIDTGSGLVDMGNSEFKTVPYALNSFTTNDHFWNKTGAVLFNTSEKIGIGTSTPTGKTEINYTSTLFDPQLTLTQEIGGDSFSRINFLNNNTSGYWAIAAKAENLPEDSRFNIWNGTTDIMSITGDGIVNIDGEIKVNNATTNGVRVTFSGNNGLLVDSASDNGVHVVSAGGNGLQVDSANNGLTVNSATNSGVAINTVGNNGFQVASAGYDGIQVASANHNGGFFKGVNAGVYAKSSIDINPDIILGGNADTSTGDDGIITSDPFYSSSDIRINSNDAVVIQLDNDNDENGQFEIKNGIGTEVFEVDEWGNTTIKIGSNAIPVGSDKGLTFEGYFGTTYFNVDFDGDATLYGTLTQNSDRRLKKNITDLQYGLTEILQLQPKIYNWKNREQKKKSLGLIAQEVQPIIKEIVNVQDNEEKTLGISYTQLIPILINAIKEQQEIIENQNVQYSSLDQENELIKQRLTRIEALLFDKNENIELVQNK